MAVRWFIRGKYGLAFKNFRKLELQSNCYALWYLQYIIVNKKLPAKLRREEESYINKIVTRCNTIEKNKHSLQYHIMKSGNIEGKIKVHVKFAQQYMDHLENIEFCRNFFNKSLFTSAKCLTNLWGTLLGSSVAKNALVMQIKLSSKKFINCNNENNAYSLLSLDTQETHAMIRKIVIAANNEELTSCRFILTIFFEHGARLFDSDAQMKRYVATIVRDKNYCAKHSQMCLHILRYYFLYEGDKKYLHDMLTFIDEKHLENKDALIVLACKGKLYQDGCNTRDIKVQRGKAKTNYNAALNHEDANLPSNAIVLENIRTNRALMSSLKTKNKETLTQDIVRIQETIKKVKGVEDRGNLYVQLACMYKNNEQEKEHIEALQNASQLGIGVADARLYAYYYSKNEIKLMRKHIMLASDRGDFGGIGTKFSMLFRELTNNSDPTKEQIAELQQHVKKCLHIMKKHIPTRTVVLETLFYIYMNKDKSTIVNSMKKLQDISTNYLSKRIINILKYLKTYKNNIERIKNHDLYILACKGPKDWAKLFSNENSSNNANKFTKNKKFILSSFESEREEECKDKVRTLIGNLNDFVKKASVTHDELVKIVSKYNILDMDISKTSGTGSKEKVTCKFADTIVSLLWHVGHKGTTEEKYDPNKQKNIKENANKIKKELVGLLKKIEKYPSATPLIIIDHSSQV